MRQVLPGWTPVVSGLTRSLVYGTECTILPLVSPAAPHAGRCEFGFRAPASPQVYSTVIWPSQTSSAPSRGWRGQPPSTPAHCGTDPEGSPVPLSTLWPSSRGISLSTTMNFSSEKPAFTPHSKNKDKDTHMGLSCSMRLSNTQNLENLVLKDSKLHHQCHCARLTSC